MLYEAGEKTTCNQCHMHQKDVAANVHHHKAYSVKLCCNSKMLGYLSI